MLGGEFMAAKYPNLAAEIARCGYSYDDVYNVAAKSAGKTVDTVSNWLGGRKGELPVTVAIDIRNALFPDMQIDYLFNPRPIT